MEETAATDDSQLAAKGGRRHKTLVNGVVGE